jgi:hypothetical protein
MNQSKRQLLIDSRLAFRAMTITLAIICAEIPCVAEQTHGLTLEELRVIRKAHACKKDWFPMVSANIRDLLLARSKVEVVQIVIHDDGVWLYRGRTDRRLSQKEIGAKDDFQSLALAMDSGYYRSIATMMATVARPQFVTKKLFQNLVFKFIHRLAQRIAAAS